MDVTPEQLRGWMFEYKLNGFILFPGLLPTDRVGEMNRQFEELLALELEIERRGLSASTRGPHRYAVNIGSLVDKSAGPLKDPLRREGAFLTDLVTEILGRWRPGKTIVECPNPGSGYMGWHKDGYDGDRPDAAGPWRPNQVKIHIPLVDVHEANGPMEVIPGSHRMYYVEGDEAIQSLPRVYSTRLLMSRGDVLLRDGDLIHRGTPNRSDTPRPLYSLIYKATD